MAPHRNSPRKDTDGGRHPDGPALGLNVQLISLHLAQFHLTLTDDVFVQGFGVLARLALPGGDRPFVHPKGRYDCRHGAAKGQQGQNDDHLPERILQSIQRRAFGLGEGRPQLWGCSAVPDENGCRCAHLRHSADWHILPTRDAWVEERC